MIRKDVAPRLLLVDEEPEMLVVVERGQLTPVRDGIIGRQCLLDIEADVARRFEFHDARRCRPGFGVRG